MNFKGILFAFAAASMISLIQVSSADAGWFGMNGCGGGCHGPAAVWGGSAPISCDPCGGGYGACGPRHGGLFLSKLFGGCRKASSCCAAEPACGLAAPACGACEVVEPTCGAVDYGCAAEPACGCAAPTCGPKKCGGLLAKLFSKHKSGCCDVEPACGCGIAEPACGMAAPAPSCGCH